jgi:hypothetical protein
MSMGMSTGLKHVDKNFRREKASYLCFFHVEVGKNLAEETVPSNLEIDAGLAV